jgi:hypothetical protein
MTEMENAQSQPHLLFNAATRRLELFASRIIVVSRSVDPDGSPPSPPLIGGSLDGNIYVVPMATAYDPWIGHEGEIVYYSNNSPIFFVPKVGTRLWAKDEDKTYQYDGGSPDPWTLIPEGIQDAYTTPFSSTVSPPSTTATNVGDALDELYALVVAATTVGEAHTLDYTPASSPPFTGMTKIGNALDELYELLQAAIGGSSSSIADVEAAVASLITDVADLEVFQIPLSIPGKPVASTDGVFHIMCVFAFRLPASLTGSYFYPGTNPTSDSTFTIKKNGSSVGTVKFNGGGSTTTVTFASDADFAAGDRLTIEPPATQDATLANVSLSLKATRL